MSTDAAGGTAPRVTRSPMRAQPWFGFWRGLMVALLPGLRFGSSRPQAAWAAAAARRRRVLLSIIAVMAAATAGLMAAAAPAAPAPMWWAHAALGVLLTAWLSAGLATALMGAWVMRHGDRHALPMPAHAPMSSSARTAVVMPICNEDITVVFAGLSATAESVAATGALGLFDFYILSDSSRPEIRAAEQRAWQHLRSSLGDPPLGQGARLFYRWRRRRTRKKAGNVADFCRRWGSRYRYMVVLDADSTMSGQTLIDMLRLMEAHPRVGILQTLPQGAGAVTLHARLQQFAGRVYGRLFALGMAYWQLGESHYWGHNAMLRVEPFMRHCALAPLPGRGGLAGEILSHDFVEAALMRRAGFEVWLAPRLAGSWEQQPPHLIDELQRDRRWCQGNLQNARLIAEPGIAAAHRAMLAVGAFSYLAAPLWLVFVLLGVLAGTGSSGLGSEPLGEPSGGGAPAAPQLGLWLLTALMLLLPRAFGVLAVCWTGEQACFGGRRRLAGGALLELLLSTLQAPVRLVAHSLFVVRALLGAKIGWTSPLRDAAAVRLGEALRGVGRLVAPPLVLAALLTLWTSQLELLGVVLPLVLAAPLVWLMAHPRIGLAALRRRWLGVPQEAAPPRELRRAAEPGAYRRLQAAVDTGPAPARGWARAWAWHHRMGLLLASLVLAAGLLPRPAQTPGFPPAWWAEAELREQLSRQLAMAPAPMLAVQVQRPVRARPARMIDNALRERAMHAVQQALAESAGEAPASLDASPTRWDRGIDS